MYLWEYMYHWRYMYPLGDMIPREYMYLLGYMYPWDTGIKTSHEFQLVSPAGQPSSAQLANPACQLSSPAQLTSPAGCSVSL